MLYLVPSLYLTYILYAKFHRKTNYKRAEKAATTKIFKNLIYDCGCGTHLFPPLSNHSHLQYPFSTYLNNLSQLLFCKLFNCFTAAASVQHQPFHHFSLVKNRPEGPPLRRLLKFHEIVRILIHIRIRLDFHLHVLYVYIYLYISYTYFMYIS